MTKVVLLHGQHVRQEGGVLVRYKKGDTFDANAYELRTMGRGNRPRIAPVDHPEPVELVDDAPAFVPTASGDDLIDAIGQLDPDNEAYWTSDGKPRVGAIESVIGRNIDASERDLAWEAFKGGND